MRPTVRHTTDFTRIQALPRRKLLQSDAEAWAEVLTEELLCRGARGALRPWQAYSLAEAARMQGAWLALPVGLGKTLLAELLPTVMGRRRPILIIPASLRDKTFHDRRAFRGVWRVASPPPRIVTPHELAPAGGAYLLDEIAPDLIIVDESDELANAESSAAARIDRYVAPRTREQVAVVAMTGTPGRNSILDYWHILCWCLREDAPVPMHHGEARMLAAAIDNKANRGQRPVDPGPWGGTQKAARANYRKRLIETPGVVIVDGDSCDQPLTIRVRLAKECPKIDAHYKRFLEDFENPDGIPVSDPLSRWRIDTLELGSGVFNYYDPPPPDAWRDARRALAKFVRDTIAQSRRTRRPLDTEGQVLRAHREHPIVLAWDDVKATFAPRQHTKTRWLSTATIETAVAWLAESDAPGIVWAYGVEFLAALEAATGLPYYGRRGRTRDGKGLHEADRTRSLIASWGANKKGQNLQAWRRMLVCQPPQSAKWGEQIFGRAHRQGQDRPVVVDWLAGSGGSLDAFETLISEAGFNQETIAMTQKVLRAHIVRAKPTITASNQFRWARREK